VTRPLAQGGAPAPKGHREATKRPISRVDGPRGVRCLRAVALAGC